MRVSLGTSRLVALALGLTLLLAGLAILVGGGGSPASVPGSWLAVAGGALLVGTLIERSRYRSDASDRSRVPAGPGGGEPRGTTLDPRFRRTDEVFADPSSGHRMRVWADPSSGERRYLAED
ncbi:MAG: hypothetical protein QOE66_665 [Chloroflexota bacterium]|jgi:hypothetical protein|nr:hypothetical protein [Chloroflexota bacterium]